MFLTPLVRFPFNKFFENYNNTVVSGSRWNMIIFCSYNRVKIMTSHGFQIRLILPYKITKYDIKIYFYRQTMNNKDTYRVLLCLIIFWNTIISIFKTIQEFMKLLFFMNPKILSLKHIRFLKLSSMNCIYITHVITYRYKLF